MKLTAWPLAAIRVVTHLVLVVLQVGQRLRHQAARTGLTVGRLGSAEFCLPLRQFGDDRSYLPLP